MPVQIAAYFNNQNKSMLTHWWLHKHPHVSVLDIKDLQTEWGALCDEVAQGYPVALIERTSFKHAGKYQVYFSGLVFDDHTMGRFYEKYPAGTKNSVEIHDVKVQEFQRNFVNLRQRAGEDFYFLCITDENTQQKLIWAGQWISVDASLNAQGYLEMHELRHSDSDFRFESLVI